MGSRAASRGTVAVAALALAAALLPGGASAAGSTLTVEDARLTDAGPGMLGGYRYTVLRLELDLADPDGLPDQLVNFEGGEFPVVVADVQREGFVVPTAADRLPRAVEWMRLTRTGGTSTQGTWGGSVVLSSVSTGRVVVDRVQVTDSTGDLSAVDLADPVHVDVATTAASAPWVYQPVSAVRVVTGRETWRPAMRLTSRAGAPVAGAWTYAEGVPVQDRVLQDSKRLYGTGTPQPTRTRFPHTSAGDGLVTLPAAYPVSRRPLMASVAGWNSASFRYHTLMAVGVAMPIVKWQAGASFAAGPGDVVTLTGNAWPAPSIYPAANPTVHLQRLVGRTWRTEASGTVRANGRYTVVWDAPDAAGYWVRSYKPGGIDANGQSAGTVGPAVWIATP